MLNFVSLIVKLIGNMKRKFLMGINVLVQINMILLYIVMDHKMIRGSSKLLLHLSDQLIELYMNVIEI